MGFKRYEHIERYGTDATRGIETGTCHIFPKLDGTNSSVWMENGKLCAGSRNRQLSIENDNAGFCAWVEHNDQRWLHHFLAGRPEGTRLHGEWLVPHSLKTYSDDAWRRFYIFDVETDDDGMLSYDDYAMELPHQADYIPPIAAINNATPEQIHNLLKDTTFMVRDGEGAGEGLVIKNYDFVNEFGRTVWGKLVTNEFKARNQKAMGPKSITGSKLIEEQAANKYVTSALCEKEYQKIVLEQGEWQQRMIPMLLGRIWHAIITEEMWNILKDHKSPTIDFKQLQFFVNQNIKTHKSELF